jgi:hypothetical protein
MAIQVIDQTKDWPISPGEQAIPGTVIGQILDPESPEGKAAARINELGLCHKCGVRKGTRQWGNSLSISHGWTTPRCDTCTYGPMLEHAWGRTKALPSLVYKYALARFFHT